MSELSIAEKRMAALEEKLLSLETAALNVSSEAGVEEALRKYQISMLSRLKVLREMMISEAGSSESLREVTEDRDRLAAENAQLKKDNDRLLYRVNHLVKALNAEEAKH